MLTVRTDDNPPARRGRGRGLTAVLRAVCGAPAGWAERRRGSFLVLVVGTLALMALITVVYVSVGSSDRRTSAALAKSDKTRGDGVHVEFADYIGTIIADDVLDTFADSGKVRREAWDYPGTDWNASSTQPRLDTDAGRDKTLGLYFTPAGGHGDDPFLASTEPTWLGWGLDTADLQSIDPERWHLYQRDWAQISNVAPDGRYVNLFNLRNNFLAEPGFGTGARSKPRLSEDLYLVGLPGNPDEPPDYSVNPPTRTDFGLPINNNEQYPAVWSRRQVGAFRQVFTGGPGPRPDSPFFPDYLFADADGDGFYDARWQQMIDARDRDADGRPDARPAFSTDSRYQFFFATRVIDLSGLVNVNTATDFRARPGDEAPVGLYPSDVDLRRLLTLRDAYDLYSPSGAGDPQSIGYNALKQPAEDIPSNYAAYTRDRALTAGGPGYDALRLSIFSGLVPTATTRIDAFASGYKIPDSAWKFDSSASGAEWRQAYYASRGGRADGVAGGGTQVQGQSGYSVTGLFGVSDLVDLLTYRGVNDPELLSRLEQVVGGRDLSVSGGANRRHSPLRDNRGLDLERVVGDPRDDAEDFEAMLRSAVDVRQRLTTVSGARPIRSTFVTAPDQLAATEVRPDLIEFLRDTSDEKMSKVTYQIATALMPDAVDSKAWSDPAGSDFRQRQTLFYGANGPATALRISAHLAVNLQDSFDEIDAATGEDTTSAYTVLLDRTQSASLSDQTLYPWWNDNKKIDLTSKGLGSLDLLGGLGARPTGIPAAINVFGVEPQPFLTEVASFTVYTDSPNNANEPEPPIGVDEFGEPIFGPITIDGEIASTNDDFVFRLVAFQIQNPFDKDITLVPSSMLGTQADLTSAAPFHYIDFGGKTYLLARLDDTGTGSLEELRIGAGETIVCYAISESRTAVNARIAAQLTTAPPPGTDHLQEWIDGQLLGPGITRAVRIPWVSASGTVETTFNTLAAAAGTDTDIVVRRALRSTVDQGMPNNPANDLIVDRFPLTLPDLSKLDRTRNSGEQEVGGTVSGPAGTEDNEGFTITLYGTVQRPTSPDKIGGFPAWCIQPRGVSSWNAYEANTEPDGLDRNDFDTDPATTDGARTFAVWTDKSRTTAVCPSACTEPAQKVDHPISNNDDGIAYATLMPEIALSNNEFRLKDAGGADGESVIRTADIALTWGVGPWHDPSQPAPQQWTTLGEAMALALNYKGGASLPAGSFEAGLAGALDRGCLKLDAYVPFFDRDEDGIFTPDPITQAFPREERRGAGVPLAMSLLDVFRGAPETAYGDEYGGLTRLTPGLININTAPLAVLRVLPLLTPTSDDAAWWWDSAISGETPLAQDADMAATVLAYRDKIPVITRPDTSGNFEIVDFRDRGSGGYSDPEIEDPTKLNGRSGRPVSGTGPLSWGTGIDVIREEPGFRSLGEVLAARQVNPADQTTYRDRNNIDHLAYDGVRSAVKGVTSTLHVVDPSDPSITQVTDIDDPYSEKLAVAAGLLNTVSVRSDVFAVWFIVRGYQQTDVEGLKADDPMRPSIERRYVLVLDRSNVLRRGDKPKVLLFKEVPL